LEVIEEMMEEMPIPFSKEVTIDDKLTVRVSGWLTKEGIIYLQSLTISPPEINYIIITTEEGQAWINREDLSSDGASLYLEASEQLFPICAQKFEIDIVTTDNEKLTLELDKREEALKEAVKGAIKDVVGKNPVMVIKQKGE